MEHAFSQEQENGLNHVETEVLTADELKEIIKKTRGTPGHTRFLPVDKGGAFKYFDVSFLINSPDRKLYYPILKINDLIVGMCELEQKPHQQNNLWIKFITIDPAYQGKHLASRLCEQIMRFAKLQNYSLESSDYNDVGYQKLRPLIHRLAKEFEVKLVGEDKRH